MRLAIVLAALPLWAQISVAVTPMPRAASQRLLGKRVANAVMMWSVSVENVGTEPVSVSPSAVLRRVANLQPYDHATVALLIEEGSRNSGWARAGRAVEDGAKVGAFLAASKQIRWGPDALTGWTAFLVFAPYVLQRFQGAAVPAGANFERLAWVTPLQLGPGESGSTHLFSAFWSEPTMIEFVIETGKAAMRRSVQ